jgi:hypothetical protein
LLGRGEGEGAMDGAAQLAAPRPSPPKQLDAIARRLRFHAAALLSLPAPRSPSSLHSLLEVALLGAVELGRDGAHKVVGGRHGRAAEALAAQQPLLLEEGRGGGAVGRSGLGWVSALIYHRQGRAKGRAHR